MAIEAVVFDIGGVLEIVDEAAFPEPFERRHGLAPGAVASASNFPADPGLGQMTGREVRAHWQWRLGLNDAVTDELWRDHWTWYVGKLDVVLYEWFAALRGRGFKTGILSNSGPGAREAERPWGFETATDDIVYSHEVGLAKPDPAVYALTAQRLDVSPEQVVLLDDLEVNVDAARAAGWHALVHRRTSTSMRDLERLLASATIAGRDR